MVCRTQFWQRLARVMGGVVSTVRGSVPGLGAGGIRDRLLPEVLGGFRVDVSGDGDEMVVVADLGGEGQEDTTIGLLSPTSLLITSVCRSARSDPGGGGKPVRHQRPVGRMHPKVWPFPTP